MASDNQRFWTSLSVLILMVAIAVTLIDLSIKAAILQESNELRRVILKHDGDQWEALSNGRREESTDDYGDNRNSDSSPDVLDIHAVGMENPDVSVNGTSKISTRKGTRSAKPGTPGDTGNVPE